MVAPTLILASRSPRRAELLRQIGVTFEVRTADVEERRQPGQSPADYAVATALAKARAGEALCFASAARSNAERLHRDVQAGVSGSHVAAPRMAEPKQIDTVVLGADTDVVIDDEILGQPKDRDDALAMLVRLSDREHKVYSGVALVQGTRCETALSVTCVCFGRITPAEAEAYWQSGEPRGKAGAYAIQGVAARWVREIHGSYSGVVGLPLFETSELLTRFGVRVF